MAETQHTNEDTSTSGNGDTATSEYRERRDYRPEGTSVTGTGLMPTLKRTFLEFSEDNLTDWAAALTYYGLLALFPALIAMVSLVGLFGDPKTITNTLTDIVSSVGPSSAADTFKGPIEN